jgi:hypothetical protein
MDYIQELAGRSRVANFFLSPGFRLSLGLGVAIYALYLAEYGSGPIELDASQPQSEIEQIIDNSETDDGIGNSLTSN